MGVNLQAADRDFMPNQNTVSEGNYVVLVKSFDETNIKMVQAQKDVVVYYGKLHFDTTPLIGCKFGDVFEITDRKMVKVENFEAYDSEALTAVSDKLSSQGDRTQFSQEKLISKKMKQSFSNVVTVLRPTLLLVSQTFYVRDKLGGLGADMLSQLITSSNVQAGSRVMVFDHNLGILTAAVMSRILPGGVCIQLVTDHEVVGVTRRTIDMLNISQPEREGSLVALTMRDLYKIMSDRDAFVSENEILQERNHEQVSRLSSKLEDASNGTTNGNSPSSPERSRKLVLLQNALKRDKNREARFKERLLATTLIKQECLDSLIIFAQNDHPLSILTLTFTCLSLSGNFVIYCDAIDPLIECYNYLKSNCLAVSLNLSESWLRTFQVLPDRTRPEMNKSGYGGYLLSGTKALYSSRIGSSGQNDS